MTESPLVRTLKMLLLCYESLTFQHSNQQFDELFSNRDNNQAKGSPILTCDYFESIRFQI